MIKNKLNIGDYIFKADGTLARITKINKVTYSYQLITGAWGLGNIAFDGIKRNSWYGHEEWFECNDIEAKALETAYKKWKINKSANEELQEIKSLIGKAKYFLTQIEDIEEIEVAEEDE